MTASRDIRRPRCRITAELDPSGRPLCEHGEPAHRRGDDWRCAVHKRDRYVDVERRRRALVLADYRK